MVDHKYLMINDNYVYISNLENLDYHNVQKKSACHISTISLFQ